MRTTVVTVVLGLAVCASAQQTQVRNMMPVDLGAPRAELGSGADPVVLDTNTYPPTLTFGQSVNNILAALTTATNWAVAPFLTYVRDRDEHKDLWGGGLAAVYNIGPYAATVIRADELDGTFYMVGGNLQLQVPFDVAGGGARMTPFGFVGVAESFGSHSSEGLVGIVGAGWDFKFPKLSQHWSVAFDAEYWSDRPGVQWRFSPLVWRF